MMEGLINLGATDIIVIGGGLSAMIAAIEAAKHVKNVALISKKDVGKSGASVISMSVFRYSPDQSLEKKKYKKYLTNGGRFINDSKLIDIIVDQGAKKVDELASMGMDLYFKDINIGGVNYRNFASCKPKKGKYITMPMADKVRNFKNISIYEGYMAIDFIIDKGCVSGVVFEKGNSIYYMKSKSVILATGGAGYIYSHTSNTRDLTGDGYAMAINANISLQDMEFVQFYPYRIVSPFQHDIFPDIFKHGAKYVNEKNERFMDKYDNKELENRDLLARELFLQNKVYLDLEQCDVEFIKCECNDLYDNYKKHRNKKLKVEPVSHFMMGGIRIIEDCSTDLEGLYCCGEVTGGLHGANRLAGNALTETAVFGSLAGVSSANYANHKSLSNSKVEIKWLPELGEGKVNNIISKLRETMWQNAGIIRNSNSLNKAKIEIESLQDEFNNIKPIKYRDWIECRNMLSTSKVIVDCCIIRKESRGAHFRDDFPKENIDMVGNILFKNGEFSFEQI